MENQDRLFDLMTKMYGEMQNGFKEVNTRLDKVEIRLDNVENRLDNLESRLDKLENTVTNIEQYHGKKLSALFDGYEQNAEKLDRIEKEVSRQEEVILRKIR